MITAFAEVRAKQDVAEETLRASIDGETVTFTDLELAKLFWYAVEVDALGVFRTLLFRYSDRVAESPHILDIGQLKRHSRFFSYVYAVVSEIKSNVKAVQDLVNELPDAITLRCGDNEQVHTFERVVRALGNRFNRLTFVHGWLRTNRIPAGVHQFSARLTALYLDGETNAESLLRFIETLEPELHTVEEIIRTLLVRRQLGDALVVAQRSPDRYKPALHQLLHPVVVRHGLPASLINFGTTFPTLANRDEIKRLVHGFIEPDFDKRMDDLLDGVDPMDTFEATPTIRGARAATINMQDSLTTHFANEADKHHASRMFWNELFEDLAEEEHD